MFPQLTMKVMVHEKETYTKVTRLWPQTLLYLEQKQLKLGVFQMQKDSEGSSCGLSSTTVFLTASELQNLQLTPFNRDLQ